MTQKPTMPAENSPAIAIEPSDEELADNGAMRRTVGLADDELLAQSGKKGGIADDELLARSGKSGGLVDDDIELA
nr:hypothetical protein [uncultured Janthinobacterium sp.]